MGKMGEAANLGAVAIVGLIVLKLMGMPKLELPKLPMLFPPDTKTVWRPKARDIYTIPEPGERDFWVDETPDIPTEVFIEILETFKAKGETFKEISEYHATELEESRDILEAAKLDLARFQTYVNGNDDVDAGGSTDMISDPTPMVWGARRYTVR